MNLANISYVPDLDNSKERNNNLSMSDRCTKKTHLEFVLWKKNDLAIKQRFIFIIFTIYLKISHTIQKEQICYG